MRFILVLVVVLLVVVFFAYPPVLEGSNGECSALESLVADRASHDASGRLIVGMLYGSSSGAPSAAAFAKDRYPLLPPAIGCAVEYWRTFLERTAPAGPPRATPEEAAARAPAAGGEPRGVTIARDMTLNGDPISPATMFTLPMDAVAIRADDPGAASADIAQFHLMQGPAVLSSCAAQKVPGAFWCKFDFALRKGNYAISFAVNNKPVGQYPFTVIGR
jgi:hypothetical protein